MKTRSAFRHGDIVFVRLANPINRPDKKKHQRLTIAKGEATGHAHVLDGEVLTFDSIDDLLLAPGVQEREIQITKQSTLTHPEHKPITLPPGHYVVRRQREFWGFTRSVSD